jgi:hypothetical protein
VQSLVQLSPYTASRLYPPYRSFHRLCNTRAQVTNETITPPVYNEDLYATLGVPSSASKTIIKNAFRRLAYANHPDHNASAEALHVFRNVTYAYKILGKDPEAKAEYDARYDRLIQHWTCCQPQLE